jgi:hypothetical protein
VYLGELFIREQEGTSSKQELLHQSQFRRFQSSHCSPTHQDNQSPQIFPVAANIVTELVQLFVIAPERIFFILRVDVYIQELE